jgi:tetratricopeptide (TPR) repeat protein
MEEFQVWEPAFLMSADTVGWTMESDSLLKLHWTRWGWDVACGGSYSLREGAVAVEIKLYIVKNGRVHRQLVSGVASVDGVERLCSDLFQKVIEAIGFTFPQSDMDRILRPLMHSPAAFQTYEAGYAYEMRRDYTAAITAYCRAFELDPSCAEAPCRIGKLYALGNAADSARTYFHKCESLAAGAPEIIAAIADFRTDHDVPEKALDFTRQYRMVLEQTSGGMKAIGKSLLLSGELQRAIAMLNRAVAKGAEDLEIDFVLGRAYLEAADYVKASDVFNRLIKYRPECMRYYALLGTAYRGGGKLMESAKVLENAVQIDPNNVQICMNLAQTYFAIGWYKDARQLLLRAREKQPDMPELCIDLGVVSWHMGKHDEAEALLKRAEKLGMTKQSVLAGEANIMLLGGDAKKAVALYRKADKAGKKSVIILKDLGNAYLALGNLRDASKCFDEALSMEPDRLDLLLLQADIAEKRKNDKDAEGYYRKIIDVSPHNLDAVERLVAVLKRQDRFKEALEPLESYLNEFPNGKDALIMQADCYRAMGWYEVAVMKYQTIVRDFPDASEGYVGLGACMYDAIRYKNARDYDKTIYYLKIAGEKNKSDPQPDYLMGLIYMDYKNYGELAIDQWKKALAKTQDPALRKTLEKLIAKARRRHE